MIDEAVEYLDLDDLVLLATGLLGATPPIRDLGLLGAAAARPRASAFGEDAYPDLWTKAAALLHSVVKDHPLVDGNERLGWLSCAVFLDLNGIDPTRASNDDVVDLVTEVAAHPIEVPELAAELRRICGLADGVDRGKAMEGDSLEPASTLAARNDQLVQGMPYTP